MATSAKRSKTLWFLSLFFAWAALKSAGCLYRVDSVTDYGLLNSIGMGVLFYVITVPLMIGEGFAAFLLFTRRARAYVIGCITITAECLSAMFTSAIAALNPDTAKSLYEASRAARGLPERSQSELDFMLSPEGIAVMALVYLAWWALVFYFLRRTKPELVQH
jgi:hypothetical protein